MKLLDKVAVEVGVNMRVPHFEGETIFGTVKKNLIFLLVMTITLIVMIELLIPFLHFGRESLLVRRGAF